MAQDSTPLTDNDFHEIKKRLTDLDEADRQIDKATRAGIEVGDAKIRSAEHRSKLLQIKQTYFPGKS